MCFQTHLTYLLYPVSCFNGQMPLESSLCSIVSSGAEWSTVFLSPLFFVTHTCTDTHTTPTCLAYVLLKLVPARVGENEMQMASQLMLSIFGNYVQESKFGLKARFPKHTCKHSFRVFLLIVSLQKGPSPFVRAFLSLTAV